MLSAVGDTLVDSTPTLRVYGGGGTIRDSELRQTIKIGSSGLSSSTSDEEWHSALRNQQKRLAATIAKSFPEIEERLEASAEDRVGVRGHS